MSSLILLSFHLLTFLLNALPSLHPFLAVMPWPSFPPTMLLPLTFLTPSLLLRHLLLLLPQPTRILQVWSTLSDLRYEINGTPVLKTEELTTSPTMNAHLDDTLAASCRAADVRAKKGLPQQPQQAPPLIPLLSRTATLRHGTGGSHADEAIEQIRLQKEEDEKDRLKAERGESSGAPLSPFEGPEASSVFKDEEEEEEDWGVGGDGKGLLGGGHLHGGER